MLRIFSISTGKYHFLLLFLLLQLPFLTDRLPCSSVGKESSCHAREPGLIPQSGRSSGEGLGYLLQYSWASLVAQLIKNPPAMRETWVQSLGGEDPLEKGKATHSSVVACRIPWTVYSPWGRKESDTTERLSHFSFLIAAVLAL